MKLILFVHETNFAEVFERVSEMVKETFVLFKGIHYFLDICIALEYKVIALEGASMVT